MVFGALTPSLNTERDPQSCVCVSARQCAEAGKGGRSPVHRPAPHEAFLSCVLSLSKGEAHSHPATITEICRPPSGLPSRTQRR